MIELESMYSFSEARQLSLPDLRVHYQQINDEINRIWSAIVTAWTTQEYKEIPEVGGFIVSCRSSIEDLYRYREMILQILVSKETPHGI